MNTKDHWTTNASHEQAHWTQADFTQREPARSPQSTQACGEEINVYLPVPLSQHRLSRALDEIIIAFGRDPALGGEKDALAENSIEKWMSMYKLYLREMKRLGRNRELETARQELLQQVREEIQRDRW